MPRFSQDYTQQHTPQDSDQLLLCTAAGTIMYVTWATLRQYAQEAFSVTVDSVAGLNALLAGKATVGHTHLIQDVDGLQSALDAKAPAVHTHTAADVTDMQSLLATKSDVGHGHLIRDVDGLQDAIDRAASTGGSGGGEGLPQLWMRRISINGVSTTYYLGVPAGMDMTGMTLVLRRCSKVIYRWRRSLPDGVLRTKNGLLHVTYIRNLWIGGREEVLPGLAIDTSSVAFTDQGRDFYPVTIRFSYDDNTYDFVQFLSWIGRQYGEKPYGEDYKENPEFRYRYDRKKILQGKRGQCAFLLMRDDEFVSRPLWFALVSTGLRFRTA